MGAVLCVQCGSAEREAVAVKYPYPHHHPSSAASQSGDEGKYLTHRHYLPDTVVRIYLYIEIYSLCVVQVNDDEAKGSN